MSDFDKAVDFCLRHESVYQRGHYGDLRFVIWENEDGDPGGVTKYGIDQASHAEVDIENLTLEQAIQIYRDEYWIKAGCDKMEWPLSQVHFDGCVNTGIGQQTKFMQRACGATPDGAWGPKTQKLFTVAVEELGAIKMAKHVCDQKETFYRQLADQKPNFQRFLKGWLNRLNDLRKDCGLLA